MNVASDATFRYASRSGGAGPGAVAGAVGGDVDALRSGAMASPEYDAFAARMAAAPPPPPPADLNELRARIETAQGALPLADGTHATEVDADGVLCVLCERDDGADDDPLFLYFHGGGYRLCSARAYRAYGSHLAKATGSRVLVVDYRLAPEHPFPAAVDDAMTVYRWALAQGNDPGRIVAGGDSAGGGLTAALMLSARDAGLPQPAGGVLLSPWADLRNTAPSYAANAATDSMFTKDTADLAAGLYLGGHDAADPLASPALADWHGLAPILIHVSAAEVLRDDAAAVAAAASAAGVSVVHEEYPEMPHVWQLFYPAFPEAVDSVDKVGAFIASVTA
jgi:acetyl esterase/lipase